MQVDDKCLIQQSFWGMHIDKDVAFMVNAPTGGLSDQGISLLTYYQNKVDNDQCIMIFPIADNEIMRLKPGMAVTVQFIQGCLWEFDALVKAVKRGDVDYHVIVHVTSKVHQKQRRTAYRFPMTENTVVSLTNVRDSMVQERFFKARFMNISADGAALSCRGNLTKGVLVWVELPSYVYGEAKSLLGQVVWVKPSDSDSALSTTFGMRFVFQKPFDRDKLVVFLQHKQQPRPVFSDIQI